MESRSPGFVSKLLSTPLLYLFDGINAASGVRSCTITLARETEPTHCMTPEEKELLNFERTLRKKAYATTTIATGPSFFDDSDMSGTYHLVIVYNPKLDLPLLSVRYYTNKTDIEHQLDHLKETILHTLHGNQNLKKDDVLFADRLSANIHHPFYRRNRLKIFAALYLQLFIKSRAKTILIMARNEKPDKLRKKYESIGLTTIGKLAHRGVDHWILGGEVTMCHAIAARLFLKVNKK